MIPCKNKQARMDRRLLIALDVITLQRMQGLENYSYAERLDEIELVFFGTEVAMRLRCVKLGVQSRKTVKISDKQGDEN